MLIGAGIMILLISCFNFVNLSTARAVNRMKEVGVRKVIGAGIGQLKIQFLLEPCNFAFFGLALAFVLSWLTIPYLTAMTDKTMASPLHGEILHISTGFFVLIGLISRTYLSFLLSSYKPSAMFSGVWESYGYQAILRKSLIVFQFVLSFVLTISCLESHRSKPIVTG